MPCESSSVLAMSSSFHFWEGARGAQGQAVRSQDCKNRRESIVARVSVRLVQASGRTMLTYGSQAGALGLELLSGHCD